MRLFEALRRRKATAASVATVTVFSLAVTTMAFLYQGITTADVELNDGGVWVTKPSGLLVGHLNYQAQLLDGGLKMTSSDFDILQHDETIITVDHATGSLAPIDPVSVTLGNAVALPAESSVTMGGNTLAVVDKTGDLFTTRASDVANFLPDPDKPLLTLGSGASATVDVDGGVHALSPTSGEMVTIPLDENGVPLEPVKNGFPETEDDAALTMTTVGDDAVVFDSANGIAYLPGGKKVDVADSTGGVLQETGPASDAVLIATDTSLIRQPLDGSAATATSAGKPGKPAAPVYLAGCAYAAWAVSNAYLRDCAGDDKDVETTIDGLTSQAQLVFRVNRNVVVLNDLTSGAVWLVNQDMKKVENWDDIVPPPDETKTDEEDDSTEEELQVILPERSEINNPPIAEPDQLGVRAGRTVVLPVLDNDSDPDGDVLTATLKGPQPSIGEVQPILGGVAMQIIVSPDASGTGTFTYTADDGRGGTADATVTLTVKAPGTNEAPVEKRVPKVLCEVASTCSYNVLPDWIDPDGDDMFVRSATADGANQVQFRADGELTFTALDPDPGRKIVTIVVSDGITDTEGTVAFEVRESGTLVPVTNADHVVTKAGQQVTVSPMANDYSPSGTPLRLAKVNEVPGGTITPDYTTGTFDFTSAAPGDYYAQYLVTDGPKSASGLVRITVVGDTSADQPPIAVRDVALLTKGRSTLTDVLANDFDPAGGILAVQSVQVPEGLGVSVEVLEHRVLRITDTGISEPTSIRYTVTNGVKTAEGEVFIIPIPAPERLLPPVATDDTVTVRAGDVATIPVLDNDYSPNGDTITLAPALIAPLIDPADGDMFVAQNTLRFKAGPVAKTVYATYEVVDSQGQRDAGYVTIQIVGNDEGVNSPPRPRDVTVRALEGTTVRIPIPLDGIDPDGDSVELVGQDGAPTKGRITEVGQSWLEYEAYPTSVGTDVFTYTVRDRKGAEASATILVGIVPSSSANQRPYAVRDTVSVRPGRSVSVDVLANDSDPDGDPIAIQKNGLDVPDGMTGKIERGRVTVTVPNKAGDYPVQYTIVDQYGATAVGQLLVSVSPDATLQPPIARDDLVQVADVVGRTSTDVDVKKNDDDPDGTIDALDVSVTSGTATVRGNGQLRIPLTPESQIITYTVTDVDGQTASAFVFVPGLESAHPALKAGTKPIVVNSGETISIPLSDYVVTGNGESARITQADKVAVSHGNGANLVTDATTLSYTSADGYYGPDALSFEVTDGTGPDDPNGKKSTLVIPITVVSTTNVSPTMNTGAVNVEPGGAEVELNLRPLSRDPDEGDLKKLTYKVVGELPQGISASTDEQTLKVKAAGNAAKGDSPIQIEVSDGQSKPGTGTVVVTVVTSTRAKPSATDDVVPQANQGETRQVDVLSNDFNPYPENPLKILEAVVETGDGGATPAGSGVDVTPAADFVGTMVVRYRIADSTGDPDREADGRIRLTVQGKPDAPTTPSVTSIQDRTVVLSWTPPVNNGAPITGYTVKSPQGYSKQCASTTCTLDGLTNDVEYTFTVTATNSVGDSDPSPSSAPARPDARPDRPAAPTLVFGDKSMTVNWVTPSTPGSAVTSYNLEISPAPARGAVQKTGVTGNSVVWEGLENGTSYQVRVQAVNRAPDPSDWSPYSAAEIPAGVPAAAGAPTSVRVDSVGSQAQMNVSWNAPNANGDKISSYILYINGGAGAREVPVAGGATSQTVTVDVSENDYTFAVAAINKAGQGATSPASAPRRAVTPPNAPSLDNASAGDNTVTVAYTPGAANGARSNEVGYQYSINGGGWSALPGDNVIRSGVGNNGTYSVALRAVTTADGSTYTSGASNSIGGLQPAGAPNVPSVTATSGDYSVKFTWGAPARNGRDFTIQVRIDGGGWEDVGSASGSRTNTYGGCDGNGNCSLLVNDNSGTIVARTVDASGAVSGEASASAKPGNPTRVTVSKGGNAQGQEGCATAGCAYVVVQLSQSSSGSFSVAYHSNKPGYENWETGSISGNGQASGKYWGFTGYDVWVTVTAPDGKKYESNHVPW
ncbi:Ig-like domain-containing protein [Agreia sp. VKM Ac-1783]|uniref:Ig-like domain-containing protein n=1 Tax=Agreia sp. VKM Ac-1783 TaxID=1938889 RepID=UPI000A2AEC49|nr:Ig-like domain-containing protein [Agreia sp. VKM Ac-1783]SMQ75451.1 Fibronectin type III domain-containing protein [Agreia sp. VKM Ac-1783]